jgi:serine/threonine protein phosphatase PrpC
VKYIYSGVSIRNRRLSNMDNLLLKSLRIKGKRVLLAVVCDGVGSLEDGAFASEETTRMLGEWIDEIKNIDSIGAKMCETIYEINTNIISRARYMNINTASTLSALLIIEDVYYTAHLGDSRIYCYADGMLETLTSDDVTTTGKLTAYIGQIEGMILQSTEGTAAGKEFILCSDGLYRRMDMELMISKINARNKQVLKKSISALIEYVIGCGEGDNITLAVVKVEN